AIARIRAQYEPAAAHIDTTDGISIEYPEWRFNLRTSKESANKQVISSQADSLIKISRIWADFFPANTSNQPI
ncbi:hypothetical protein M1902_28805, partial [Klebsiella pneumoniae]|nr:hypothetical protein [Klebsiella pneumoniae]